MSSCLRALDTALVDSAGCIWMQLDLFNETQNSGGVPQSKKKKDIEHESSMHQLQNGKARCHAATNWHLKF